MRKTLDTLVIGILGALAGCPSAPVQQERTQNVAPVQSANVHSITPVERAAVQRSIKEETRTLVGYLKKSEKPFFGLFSAQIYFGDRAVEVSWYDADEERKRACPKLVICEDVRFEDNNGDGSCDSVERFGIDKELMSPSSYGQKEFESVVRKIVSSYRAREEWITSRVAQSTANFSDNDYTNKAHTIIESVIRSGDCSLDGGFAVYERFASTGGSLYKLCVKTGIDGKIGPFTSLRIEKVSSTGEAIERFFDYDSVWDSPLGSCDSASIPPGFFYLKGVNGIDAESAVQIEYKCVLDRLADAVEK